METYESLKLDNQLCFPLYAAAREVVKKYTPLLNKLDITYTQYITLMVLWEKHDLSVKELGQKLFLDSGTLTPLLKSLEKKGFVKRSRSTGDGRVLNVSLTKQGEELKNTALSVPQGMQGCIPLSPAEAFTLYSLLYKILGKDVSDNFS